MKNLTITLDEDVAQWVRVRAARQNTSMSRLIGEWLRSWMLEQEGYHAAMKQFLSVEPRPISEDGVYPSREELYDRT